MPPRKITDEQIAKARELRQQGWSYSKIANALGISSSAVRYHIELSYREKTLEYQKRYRGQHREQIRERSRQYYWEHREERLQKSREYRRKNAEEIARRNREYRRKHPEIKRQQDKRYYQRHREQILQRHVEYRREHNEQMKQIYQRYYQAHKESYYSYRAARRSLEEAAYLNLTPEQRAAIREIYRRAREDPDVRCYICGRKIPMGHRHVDHIIPLSRGGRHEPSNLAIACDKCNLSKGDKLLDEAFTQGHFDAPLIEAPLK